MRARMTYLAIGVCLAGCASGGPLREVEIESIDRAYHLFPIPWREGGHMLFITKAGEREGKLRICGAYGTANAGAFAEAAAREVADSATMRLGGVWVASGLGFMARHDGRGDPVGQAARCVVTAMDWRDEFQYAPTQIRLAREAF